jgi:hypothetical protein
MDMAGFWKMITGDSQLRWLGPEKGVIHLATGASQMPCDLWQNWRNLSGINLRYEP